MNTDLYHHIIPLIVLSSAIIITVFITFQIFFLALVRYLKMYLVAIFFNSYNKRFNILNICRLYSTYLQCPQYPTNCIIISYKDGDHINECILIIK